MKTYTSNFWAYAGLVAAMMLWASSFVALKLAFRGYDPMIVIFGRMLVATICFLPWVPRVRSGNALRQRDLKPLLFMALCEPCLYFIFEARALELTSASQAGMITALLPLMVAVGARVVLKEVLTVGMLVGFGLAIAGAVWLSLAGEATAEAPRPLLGNFLEFMAMVCATGYTISLKRLTRHYTPFFLT
ncbi:MAG: DMT family transporter, partial [Oceanisphaera sp.]|nr:DMT family transporter [Oceanisphaera sp.]